MSSSNFVSWLSGKADSFVHQEQFHILFKVTITFVLLVSKSLQLVTCHCSLNFLLLHVFESAVQTGQMLSVVLDEIYTVSQ